MEKFLLTLAKIGSVTAACEAIGVGRSTAYEWRDDCGEFAAAWESAIDVYVDRLEVEADRRARDGVGRGVYYKGKRVDTRQEFSDTLLMFRLKALRPEKYRDNAKLDLGGSVEVRAIERIIIDPKN